MENPNIQALIANEIAKALASVQAPAPAPAPAPKVNHWDAVNDAEKALKKARKVAVASLDELTNEEIISSILASHETGIACDARNLVNKEGGFTLSKATKDAVKVAKEKHVSTISTAEYRQNIADTITDENTQMKSFTQSMPNKKDGSITKTVRFV